MNVDDLLRCLVVLTQPCAVDRMVKLKLQSNIVFDPLPKKNKKNVDLCNDGSPGATPSG